MLLAASVVLAAAFLAADRRTAAALLPAALLRVSRLRQGTLAAALNTVTTSSALTLATLYLQDTQGRSPLAAAAMLLPFSLAVIACSAVAAPALRRSRPQHLSAAGLAAIAAADLTLIWAAPSPWALPACVAAAGAGIGLSSVAATGLATDVDPPPARHRDRDHQHRGATRHRLRHRRAPSREPLARRRDLPENRR